MDVHERIIKSLNHEEPDRVPTFTQTIERAFVKRYNETIGITNEFNVTNAGVELARELGYDSKWVHSGGVLIPMEGCPEIPKELEILTKGKLISPAGEILEVNSVSGEAWYVNGLLKTPELLKEWTDFLKGATYKEDLFFKKYADFWYDSIDKGIVPIPTAGEIAYPTWACIGMDRFAYMIRKYPQLVKEMIKMRTNQAINAQTKYYEEGIDIIMISEDFAQKNRLMMNPKQFVEFFEPAYTELADHAHKYGAKLIVHSDGNLTDAFPSFIRAGVDGAEPLEYEAGMRLKPLKEKWGDKITLVGNVGASEALCIGSKEETIRQTKQCIKDTAEGGGFILSQGANLLADSKIENVLAMISTVKKYGVYPIRNNFH